MTRVKEGDPVGVAWLHDACGACEYCITGWETLCEAQHNSGYSVNGAFAEYVIGSAAYVARLPDRPDFVAMAPILCAGVTTYKGIKETETRPGAVARDLRDRRARPPRGAVRQGDGAARRGARRGRGRSSRSRARSAPTSTVDAKARRCRAAGRHADRRRRARRARDRRVAGRVRAGAPDGAAQGHREPGRPAARRLPDADLRRRAEAHHHPRLDRRDARGSRRSDRSSPPRARCARTSTRRRSRRSTGCSRISGQGRSTAGSCSRST